jgi:REP element-mobilizing transposase RayT
MTAPRQVLPGATYLVTRRCIERRFLLRPSDQTNGIFRYVLAVASARHGILIHAFCVLSNHFHLVLTDPNASLPAFERDLDSLVARATNASLGRWEYFWDSAGYSAVALEDHGAIREKIVYVLANPVAAGLVRHASEWPGLWSNPAMVGGKAQAVERPRGFFRERGPLPPVANLQLHVPRGFESSEAFLADISGHLRDAENRAAAGHGVAGRSFLGAARVLAQQPSARPPPVETRRQLRPRIATRDRWRRLDAILRLRRFVHDYREARAAWCKGLRSAIFPPGTYMMRVLHAVGCAPVG